MKLALIGYGRMGHVIDQVAKARGHEVVARLDMGDAIDAQTLAGARVAFDFTLPDAVIDNARRVAGAGVGLVIGTTGWYERMDELKSVVASAEGACIWSPNFSLGVQAFLRIASAAGRLADALEEYDVHVHEQHHRHKVDHPSGTAIRLAEVLLDALRRKTSWKEGPPAGAPDPATLWISTARAGEIPGTHEVALEGPSDSILVRHTARGRDGFARGAVEAAEWLAGRTGFFEMDDLLADRLGRREER
jgi:4-hydroxy-tetrahydrodipicolinate reductase